MSDVTEPGELDQIAWTYIALIILAAFGMGILFAVVIL